MKLIPTRYFRKATGSRQQVTNALPAELLVEIASHLTWAVDVLNFSLTSSQMRTILLPEMYKSIFLFSGGWTGAFEMFEKHPELCVHVRRLGVDLIYEALRPELWRDDVDIDHIAALIEKASGRLLNLQTFTWSGRRLPPDHLFRTLRNACPQLKNLHCLTKSIRIDPGSELFKFDDLAGFTLWVAYDDKISEPTPMQDIPVELGDMLLQRCPNLNTLSIRLRSMPNIWIQDVEIDRLLSGVWPKLQVCDLEIEVIDSDPILVWPPASTLRGFFSVHSSITELMLQSYARFPTTVLTRELPLIFDASALGQLTSFEGLLQHVAEIPDPAALKILVLCTVVSETSAEPILAVLRRLTSLRGLTLEFSDIKASTFIRDIVSACPSVASLHVKFYKTVFNLKQLADFSAGLRDLSQLRSLYFDKVYSSSDGTLLATALMLLGDIPLLQEICIVNFMANHWYQRGHYLVVTTAKGRRVISGRESGLDHGYPHGRFVGKLYPHGKFNRKFRYSLESDVLQSISKRFKRIRR